MHVKGLEIIVLFLVFAIASCLRLLSRGKDASLYQPFCKTRISLSIFGRKISDEDKSLKASAPKIKTSKGKKRNNKDTETPIDDSSKNVDTEIGSVAMDNESEPQNEMSREEFIKSQLAGSISGDLFGSAPEGASIASRTDKSLELQRQQELQEQGQEGSRGLQQYPPGAFPPEVLFFGDPRRPPPAEAGQDPKHHGRLLYWARHATFAPRGSSDRLETVFPRGRLHPRAPALRFKTSEIPSLTFNVLYDRFVSMNADMETMKAFIDANIDIIPGKMFLRALTVRKLELQYAGDVTAMEEVKTVRDMYIIAHDQVFFPFNLEVQKAETRVMTYLSRVELRDFALSWDETEVSLHMTTLLAARLVWDATVRGILDNIKDAVDDTVGYFAEGIRRDLMTREFRKPGITAAAYMNASMSIQKDMPGMYARIRPEIRFMHESYFIDSKEDVRTFAEKEFCPSNGISLDQLKEKLRLYEGALAAVQGVDYGRLLLRVRTVFENLCDDEELACVDKWFLDMRNKGYSFETYEPDTIPTIINSQESIRDTGNAFLNFAMEVLGTGTIYSDPFSGQRPKASDPAMNNWLEKDPIWNKPGITSYEQCLAKFREAYVMQSKLRKEAEDKLNTMVWNRMENQDKYFLGLEERKGSSNVQEFSDKNEDVKA